MSKIAAAFKKQRKCFIPFITAGDPNLDVTEQLIVAMANIPVKAPAAWACLLPNRSANYISFTSDIIIQESIVSRSIFSISRNKIHFFPDFKIFSVLGSTFEL